MKMRPALLFLLTALFCAALGACGKQEEPAARLSEPGALADAPAETQPVRHILESINDHHTIDADIFPPASAQIARHRMEFLSVPVEKAVEILCPGDTIVSREEAQDRSWVLAVTAGGKQVQVDSGMVSVHPPLDADSGWEQMYLNGERYFADYPEKQGTELDFMTAAEAKALAANVLQELGVALQPEFTLCAGVMVGELDAYVRELRTENEFKASLLQDVSFADLREDEACYLVKMGFGYDGTHVLGWENEPSVGMHGWSFPSMTQWGMVISANGIEYLDAFGLLSNPKQLDSAPVLPAESALEAFQQEPDMNFSPEFQSVVTRVFLEYVPVPDGKQVILTPYWCVDRREVAEFPDLHPWEQYRTTGYRYNAYTCGDLADWK